MGYARAQRRRQKREAQPHLAFLATLLGGFYEFLGSSPQPSADEVRERFISTDNRWRKHCAIHKLMNANHLFMLNVQEAWKRHTAQGTTDGR